LHPRIDCLPRPNQALRLIEQPPRQYHRLGLANIHAVLANKTSILHVLPRLSGTALRLRGQEGVASHCPYPPCAAHEPARRDWCAWMRKAEDKKLSTMQVDPNDGSSSLGRHISSRPTTLGDMIGSLELSQAYQQPCRLRFALQPLGPSITIYMSRAHIGTLPLGSVVANSTCKGVWSGLRASH